METQTPQLIPLFSWRALRHPQYERTRRWYAVTGAITAGFLLYSIFTKAWSFTLVIVVGILAYVLVHRKGEHEVDIIVTEQGILIDSAFTPWIDCDRFWVIRTPMFSELHIRRAGNYQQELTILTGTIDILTLRTVLRQFLTEDVDRHESILDKISRICKL